MRVFFALLVIVAAAILFMLPLTQAVYDFRTDGRTDSFLTTTGAVTTANVTLTADPYDCDIATIDIDSANVTDTPLPGSVNCTTRVLLVEGLTTNITRILEVNYYVDALDASPAISVLLDRVPWIWLLVIIAFAPVALYAIFTGRA